MTTVGPETSLPGSLTQEGRQEDHNLFADIKAADWLDARDGSHTNGQGLRHRSSGSVLLDDIRAMDAINTVRSRCRAEADEPLDQMADPISLKWVKSVGWVRSGTLVIVLGKVIRVGPSTEQPRTLSNRECQSIAPFAVSTTVYAWWMLPQGRGPPVCKANRSYRVTLKFLNHDRASVANQPARSGEACSSQRGFAATPACVDQAPPRKRRHAFATRNAPFHGG